MWEEVRRCEAKLCLLRAILKSMFEIYRTRSYDPLLLSKKRLYLTYFQGYRYFGYDPETLCHIKEEVEDYIHNKAPDESNVKAEEQVRENPGTGTTAGNMGNDIGK